MLEVSPYIAYKGNCREAIEFYKSALDAKVLFTQTVGESPMPNMRPPENIMHCSMKVGDSTMMMCDARAKLLLIEDIICPAKQPCQQKSMI